MTDLTNASGKPHRFEVLDSWRGICACAIVLFHFNDEVLSHFKTLPLTANSYIFVDFFFVLSGFVIAANYRDKLLSGMRVRDYTLLRFGRIYPLHFVTLMLYVAFEFSKYFVDTRIEPFSTQASDLRSFVANIFLLQSIGILEKQSWNGASWSIGVEFYTYIIYAFALIYCRGRLWIPAMLIILTAPFIFMTLGKVRIDVTHDYALLRCLYGFSCGVIACQIFGRVTKAVGTWKPAIFTGLEIFFVSTLLVFLAYFARNEVSFWVPWLFFAMILLFAMERGIISRLLRLRPLLFIGMLSYSIYMMHGFIQLVVYNIAKIVERVSGDRIFFPNPDGRDYDLITMSPWTGDIIQLLVLALVIAASTLTYYIIEKPANDWFRAKVRKKSAQISGSQAQNH